MTTVLAHLLHCALQVSEKQCPGYSNVIKHKKALSDVRTSLNRGDYSGTDAFIADVGLIVSNCFTYNCGNQFVIQVS